MTQVHTFFCDVCKCTLSNRLDDGIVIYGGVGYKFLTPETMVMMACEGPGCNGHFCNRCIKSLTKLLLDQ